MALTRIEKFQLQEGWLVPVYYDCGHITLVTDQNAPEAQSRINDRNQKCLACMRKAKEQEANQ